MTVFFPIVAAFGVLSCLPAWFAARRRGQAGTGSLFIILPGLVGWLLLATAGIGPQSLSSLVIELSDLTLGSVVLYYLKVFVLDRYTEHPRRNTAYVVLVTLATAVLLRFYMPHIST
ncbi:MAG TPA: hypothetical protein VJ910_10400 [Desulfuromonadales bacterium]|nr:hypothetical protein [Desulfuromonadales bacterium]